MSHLRNASFTGANFTKNVCFRKKVINHGKLNSKEFIGEIQLTVEK